MNNSNKQIDIRDIFLRLLSQWKAVMIVSLLCALFMAGFKYHKDVTNYNAAVAESAKQEELSQDEINNRIEEILDKLGDERALVNLVLQQEKQIEQQEKYINESLYLQLDPDSVTSARISYRIISDENELNKIYQIYYAFFNSDEFISRLASVMECDKDSNYIRELVSFEVPDKKYSLSENGPTVNLRIIIPANTEPEKILEFAEEEMSKCQKKYKDSAYEIEQISKGIYTEVDTDINTQKTNAIINMNSVQSALKVNRTSLSANQSNAIKEIKKLLSYNSKEEGASAHTTAPEIESPHINKKYVAIGFIIGAILYALCLILNMLIKDLIWSTSDAEFITGSRVLGSINSETKGSGLDMLLHSKFFEKKLYGDIASAEKQKRTGESIISICNKRKVNNVSFVEFEEKDEKLSSVIDTIRREIDNAGITTEVIRFDSDANELKLSLIDNLILVVSINETRADLVRSVVALIKEYSINCLGVICLQQI